MYVEYGYDTGNLDQALLVDLMRAHAFTSRDLEENRRGRISTRQMLRLSGKAIFPLLALVVPFIGLAAMTFAFAEAAPFLVTKVRLLLAMGNYVAALMGAIVFGFIALVINLLSHSGRLLLFLLDLAAGRAAFDFGRVYTGKGEEIEDGIDQVLRRKTITLNYVLKGHSYPVSQAAYDAFVDHAGAVCKLYHTPRSRFLLAMEPAGLDGQEKFDSVVKSV